MIGRLSYLERGIYRYATSGDPHFMVRLYWRGREFRRKGLPTLQAARDYRTKIRGQQIEARFFPERRASNYPSLNDYARGWLLMVGTRGLKHNTVRSYRQNLQDHILPRLGHTRLSEITRQEIATLLREKRQAGLAPNSLRLILAPLSKLFNDAQEIDGFQLQNPCSRPGRITQVRSRRHPILPFTKEEAARVLKTCLASYPSSYAFLLTLLRTGLRSGEAVALIRSDLNFSDRLIQVTKNYTNGCLEESPKSSRARAVDMSAQLAQVLRQHLIQTGPDLVFPSVSHGYFDVKNWRTRVWYPLLAKAGLPRRPPHHIRHTYAILLISDALQFGRFDAILPYLKAQLGHSSIQVTIDIYGHLLPGRTHHLVDRLDQQSVL